MPSFCGMRWDGVSEDRLALLALYEHNYMGFRLLLPQPPGDDAWYVLKAHGRADVFLRRLSDHPYTSEWLLGHAFPGRRRTFSPDYTIRLYHDMRLAEAMIDPATPVRAQRARKFAQNRALHAWLAYCRRYGYQLAGVAEAVLP